MLYKLAWSYHNTTGLDIEDLKSEANIAFITACNTHNPEKAKLSTWIWKNVQYHLNAYIKKYIVEFEPLYDEIPDTDNRIEARENFNACIENMSQEAQQIVRIVLDSPGEFFELSSRYARGILFRKLREMGWSWSSIWDSFREIKTSLNS